MVIIQREQVLARKPRVFILTGMQTNTAQEVRRCESLSNIGKSITQKTKCNIYVGLMIKVLTTEKVTFILLW